MSKLKLLTHVSYDAEGNPYLGSPTLLSPNQKIEMPANRLTGVFGRRTEGRVVQYWWKESSKVFNKALGKVECYVNDVSGNSDKNISTTSQENVGVVDVLNLFFCQRDLLDDLESLCAQDTVLKVSPKKKLRSHTLHYKCAQNPQIINKLFDVSYLSHIKAIVWPMNDIDKDGDFFRMVTLRDPDIIDDIEVYNMEDGVELKFVLNRAA